MSPLDLMLFGGLSVRRATGEAIHIVGHKDQALLGFLATSPGTSYGRDRLARLLWSDHGEKQARDSLKQCLLRLRRALGSAEASPLLADRQSVALEASLVTVDVAAFEANLRNPSTCSG